MSDCRSTAAEGFETPDMRRGSSVVRIALAIILVEDSPTCVGDISQEADALAINLVGQRALFVAPRCCDIISGKMRARAPHPKSSVIDVGDQQGSGQDLKLAWKDFQSCRTKPSKEVADAGAQV